MSEMDGMTSKNRKPGNTFSNQLRAMPPGDAIMFPITGTNENSIRMRAQRLNGMGEGLWRTSKRGDHMQIRRIR